MSISFCTLVDCFVVIVIVLLQNSQVFTEDTYCRVQTSSPSGPVKFLFFTLIEVYVVFE